MDKQLNVIFLNKQYSLPADILTYISERQYFDSLHQSLLSYMLQNFYNFTRWPKDPQYDNDAKKLAKGKFVETANICIQRLYQKGIYNKTVDDYTINNPGITLLEESMQGCLREWLFILKEQTENLLRGIDEAEQYATSQITGTGFRVYTSSAIEMGVWAAMESSTLKKQAASADRTYRAMLDQLDRDGESRSEQRITNYCANVWMPQLKNSVDTFIAAIFDMYIHDMTKAGMFQSEALQYNNKQRSDALLLNLPSANNKSDLLHEAFISCPYSTKVYLSSIENGLLDHQTLHTARTFGLVEPILFELESTCKEISSDLTSPESSICARLKPHIDTISLLKGTSADTELATYLSPLREHNLNKLSQITYLSPTTCEFDTLIRAAIAPEVDDILIASESANFTDDIFLSYIERSILNYDDSPYYQYVKVDSAQKLFNNALIYIQEARRRKEQYLQSEQYFILFNDAAQKFIAKCNAEIDSLGFFGFSKKKTLQQQITEKQQQVEHATQKLASAKASYTEMYRQST